MADIQPQKAGVRLGNDSDADAQWVMTKANRSRVNDGLGNKLEFFVLKLDVDRV